MRIRSLRYGIRSNRSRFAFCLLSIAALGFAAGCPIQLSSTSDGSGAPAVIKSGGVLNNTNDRTNNGANFIGSAACKACHFNLVADLELHGHSQALQRIQDGPPHYPSAGTRAGGFDPPTGKAWADIAFVVGGYIRKALFVDTNGFLMSNGVDEVNTQWNLSYPPNGTSPGFVPYEPERGADDPKPYDFSCFVCHTTGPLESHPADPTFQDNRPGMAGTFAEAGVQCEACHGPGSNHIPNPAAREIFVDTAASVCNDCHSRPFGSTDGVIRAADGFVQNNQQNSELRASGGHAAFTCTTCHDAHVSVTYDRERGLRNQCTGCHGDQNMALHEGKVYARGAYFEPLRCESCHMPFATHSASAAPADVVGGLGRMGDMRTHIFRINTGLLDYTSMFTADGGQVVEDGLGRAGVTLDFVCLRCHNGLGNAFNFEGGLQTASDIAPEFHKKADLLR